MVSAGGGKEGVNTWAGGELATAQFLERLDARFAVGQHTCLGLGRDDIRSKMFDGGRDGQCFNFAREPSNLIFSGLCAKETSKKQFVVTKGIECGTQTNSSSRSRQ